MEELQNNGDGFDAGGDGLSTVLNVHTHNYNEFLFRLYNGRSIELYSGAEHRIVAI